MNSVNIAGRLVRDPELRVTGDGLSITRFTLAVDKQLSKEKKEEMEAKNQPTADFINCVSFGKQADFIQRNTSKGGRVGVSGRLQTGSYQAKDGSKRYTTDVVVIGVDIYDWSDSQGAGSSNGFGDFDSGFGDFDSGFDDGRIPF